MKFIVCPLFDSIDAALDWFAERGAERPVLWRGPDGKIRGTARVRAAS